MRFAAGPKCEPGLKEEGNFCVPDNDAKPEPEENPVKGPKKGPKPEPIEDPELDPVEDPEPEPEDPEKGPKKGPKPDCGKLNQACCNIPDNNPNIGDCREGACWEGTCMPCGIDGKPSCDSATPHHPH